MFKIYPEFKTIPTWFHHFEPKKLIDHPVESIKHLIWLIQAGTVLIVLFTLSMAAMAAFTTGESATLLILSLVAMTGAAFSQTVILGIHARSKLAWLLLASAVLRMSFSFMFIGGLIGWYLIDQDETLEYFKGAQPLPAPTLNQTEGEFRAG